MMTSQNQGSKQFVIIKFSLKHITCVRIILNLYLFLRLVCVGFSLLLSFSTFIALFLVLISAVKASEVRLEMN